MQLTLRSVCEMFRVSEATIKRWVKQRGLPAQHVAGQYRFNRVEVFDWAIANQIKLERDSLEPADESNMAVSLATALEAGGVHYNVPGEQQEPALRAVISRLPLPDGFDREMLFRLFLAREALGSTAIGHGIAIPHARRPIVLNVPHPLVTLCFLKRPILYQAPDGKPVRVLFSVISPTVETHLHLLARLSLALHDDAFQQAIEQSKAREIILREARRVEGTAKPLEDPKPRAA